MPPHCRLGPWIRSSGAMLRLACHVPAGGYAAMGARWHRSLETSVAAHLPGNHQINSMCCAMEDIYK